MLKQLLPALRATLVLAFYTGIVFPIVITLAAKVMFPDQAKGSLIRASADRKILTDSKSTPLPGAIIGSRLLGQSFTRPEYFHPRPSAAGSGYAGEASGGTNYGPTSSKLILGDKDFAGIKQLAESYRKENALAAGAKVPVDAVTRSASGLDPHVTTANADLQLPRVAKARNMSESAVRNLLEKYTESRDCWILGEPRVNVLLLNIALDESRK